MLRIRTHGYIIYFHPSEFSCDLWYDPSIRMREINLIKSYLKPGDTYVDVGANIGTLVLAAAFAVQQSGRVIAFEPHPRIFRYLRSNVALNRVNNVEMHNCALGERSDTVSFSDFKADDVNKVTLSSGKITVPLRTLEDELTSVERISLLKIDVEGYEKFVLEGAASSLSKVACVYIELSENNFKQFGYCSTDVVEVLEELGFEIYEFVDDTGVSRMGPEHRLTTSEVNIIAVRSIKEFVRRTGWRLF